jgi:hypothetical protein
VLALLLLVLATAPETSGPTPVPVPLYGLMSTRDVRLYVLADGGSDLNTCTATAPCQTLQRAVNLLPKGVRHAETVHAYCGTYTCAKVSGFVGVLGYSPDGGLTIEGELATATWDGGAGSSMTGTALFGTAGSTSTFGTIVTSNLYDVNALVGHYIAITGGYGNGLIRPISSNDAGTITVVGTWNVDAGSTYAIQDPCSFVSSPPSDPNCAQPSTGAAAANATATWGFYFTNNSLQNGTSVIELRNWGNVNDAGFLGSFIGVADDSSYNFDQLMTPLWSTTQGSGISICNNGQCTARLAVRNGVQAQNNSAAPELLRIQGGAPNVTILNGLAYNTNGSASLMLTFAGSPTFNIQSSEVNGVGSAGAVGIPNGYGTISSSRFDCVVGGAASNVAIVSGSQSRQISMSTTKPLPQESASVGVSTTDIGTHCGYGILTIGPAARSFVNGLTGNGTTACMVAAWGGRTLQNGSNTCTGTTSAWNLDNGNVTGQFSDLTAGSCATTLTYGSSVCNQ